MYYAIPLRYTDWCICNLRHTAYFNLSEGVWAEMQVVQNCVNKQHIIPEKENFPALYGFSSLIRKRKSITVTQKTRIVIRSVY